MSHAAIATAPTSARRWIACVVLLAGAFMPPADFFIVNVSLSSIHEALHATPAQVQLVISGYGAGYAVFLVTGGGSATCMAGGGCSYSAWPASR